MPRKALACYGVGHELIALWRPADGAAASGTAAAPSLSTASANSTTFAVILSLSFCHLLNDMMQSLVPALYPILKETTR